MSQWTVSDEWNYKSTSLYNVMHSKNQDDNLVSWN